MTQIKYLLFILLTVICCNSCKLAGWPKYSLTGASIFCRLLSQQSSFGGTLFKLIVYGKTDRLHAFQNRTHANDRQ